MSETMLRWGWLVRGDYGQLAHTRYGTRVFAAVQRELDAAAEEVRSQPAVAQADYMADQAVAIGRGNRQSRRLANDLDKAGGLLLTDMLDALLADERSHLRRFAERLTEAQAAEQARLARQKAEERLDSDHHVESPDGQGWR